jgi:hypothetical protein
MEKSIDRVFGPTDHGNRAGPWSTMDSRGAPAKYLPELDVVALGDGGGLGDPILALTGWSEAVESAGGEVRRRWFNCTR